MAPTPPSQSIRPFRLRTKMDIGFRKGILMSNDILRELKADLAALQKSRDQEMPPMPGLEIIRTLDQAAKVLGVSRMSLYRYRDMFPDFPALPAFRMSLKGWAERYRLPRKRGPIPSHKSRMVASLREQGLTFEEIGKRLRIPRASAFRLWRRGDRRGECSG